MFVFVFVFVFVCVRWLCVCAGCGDYGVTTVVTTFDYVFLLVRGM